MTPLERDIERALVSKAEQRGGLCLKWVCPGWAGVPDRILLLSGGVVMFAETKRPKGGRLSPLQVWWHKTLRGMGFTVLVIWSHKDIEMLEGMF